MAQENISGISPGATTGLQNNRRISGFGCLHDGNDLFKVVDVERWQAVIILSRVIEKLSH
jgi:hypothetical protein